MDDLQLEDELETPIKNYKHALAKIQCNPSLPACLLGECKNYPGVAMLKERLLQCFEIKGVEEIEYKQWTTTKRSQLQTFIQSTDEFIERFLGSLKTLTRHDFIAQEQAKYLDWKKNNLSDGEFLVIGDFSENYAFIIQGAAQGYHWTNNQATLHPFVFYYKYEGNLCHGSYVLLLECNTHDTIAVHLFQRKLINFLKVKFEVLKITYFSDGCAAQYKNCKNFINLCYHKEDFGIPAEWHFFATSHGKGPCDGVGGTVKREAAKASLQRPYHDQIMTTYQLYTFAKENIHGISFEYLTANDWQIESTILKERFSNAKTIPGTQKLHCFKPLSTNELQVQDYSSSSVSRIEKITSQNVSQLNFSSVTGYMVVEYDEHWWIGCVLESNPEKREVTMNFLHPHGPSQLFSFRDPPDIFTVDLNDLLLAVEPKTTTGWSYFITSKESEGATKALNLHHR